MQKECVGKCFQYIVHKKNYLQTKVVYINHHANFPIMVWGNYGNGTEGKKTRHSLFFHFWHFFFNHTVLICELTFTLPSLDLPNVGIPRWLMYSLSTTPTFRLRSPCQLEITKISKQEIHLFTDLFIFKAVPRYQTMTIISPAHNNQVWYLGPKHGSGHSATQSKISQQGKISCYTNLIVNPIRKQSHNFHTGNILC